MGLFIIKFNFFFYVILIIKLMGKEFKNISETKKEATKKRKVDEQNQVKKEIKK